jgi:transposase
VATPTKIRQAIVRAIEQEGLTYEDTARLLGVGRATISRLLRRFRETGSVEPAPKGGGNFSPIRDRVDALLSSIVSEMPDATVAELTAALIAKAKIKTSRSSTLRALHRLGFTLKKSPSPHWSARPKNTASTVGRSAARSRR